MENQLHLSKYSVLGIKIVVEPNDNLHTVSVFYRKMTDYLIKIIDELLHRKVDGRN